MEDLIGSRFGKLLVVALEEPVKNKKDRGFSYYYSCTCDCGNTTRVLRRKLKEGRTKSCGCLRGVATREKMRVENDLTGKKFGRWTVISRCPETFKKFSCLCECGNSASVEGHALKSGKSTSCGCYFKEQASRRLMDYVEGYRESVGSDPLTPLVSEDVLQRAAFKDKLQKKILIRDNFTCVFCSTKSSPLNVHHLDTWKQFPERRFDESNLVTLCVPCHKEIHFQRYSGPVDEVKTILLKGYAENEVYLSSYFQEEKVEWAARIGPTP